MKPSRRTFALIPAAGHSTRMGRPKLALPLGEGTVLGHVIGALHDGGIKDVLVVLGPHVGKLLSLVRAAGGHALLLSEPTADMRATVFEGLDNLIALFCPGPDDAWLLVPGDHPTLDSAVVRKLIRAWRKEPEFSIFVPTYQGQRGHPVLIGWRHVRGMRRMKAGQGLNVYLRKHTKQTLEVPVKSADILCDLDTPEDYARLRRSWQNRAARGTR